MSEMKIASEESCDLDDYVASLSTEGQERIAVLLGTLLARVQAKS